MHKRNRKAILKITGIALLLLAFLLSGLFFAGRTALKAVFPLKYSEVIEKYAEEYAVPAPLLYAVVHTESGFDKDAKSHMNAIGLTQITEDTFNWLQTKTGEHLPFEALYEPEVSVKYCAVFYHLLLEEFGDTQTAVAAYHAGRGRVNAWVQNSEYSNDGKTLSSVPESETKKYVRKVLFALSIYENLYREEFKHESLKIAGRAFKGAAFL